VSTLKIENSNFEGKNSVEMYELSRMLTNNQVKTSPELEVLTVEEVAYFLHVSKLAIYSMIHNRFLFYFM
jgi:hypothetical protein